MQRSTTRTRSHQMGRICSDQKSTWNSLKISYIDIHLNHKGYSTELHKLTELPIFVINLFTKFNNFFFLVIKLKKKKKEKKKKKTIGKGAIY
jgi:hypothetical protein